jgi:pimeloyl-ACP methyl ester carboxylesterase
MTATAFHSMPDGNAIAYRFTPGAAPAVVFLSGYRSDMQGTKAAALEAWAARVGRACLLLDYSGCGESSGDFAQGTLTGWAEQAAAVIRAHIAGRMILVGSSMGGWLMLLLAPEFGMRLAGLVGIAAAPDFTDWGFTAEQQAMLAAGRPVFEDSPYGDEPTPVHPGFEADGQANRVLEAPLALACPVRLLHGQDDATVPPAVSLRLAEALHSADVQVTLIKHGDHRLSRDSDIALLVRTLEALD